MASGARIFSNLFPHCPHQWLESILSLGFLWIPRMHRNYFQFWKWINRMCEIWFDNALEKQLLRTPRVYRSLLSKHKHFEYSEWPFWNMYHPCSKRVWRWFCRKPMILQKNRNFAISSSTFQFRLSHGLKDEIVIFFLKKLMIIWLDFINTICSVKCIQ